MAGIDYHEMKQLWGKHAKQVLKAIVDGYTVKIEVVDTDRYGRTVGRVFVDGVNVNCAMVAVGHCSYAKDEPLFMLQDEAKAAQRGLWRLPEPERVPPWEWRRSKRK